MALPHGAMGWSAVCDCGISWSYSLFVLNIFVLQQQQNLGQIFGAGYIIVYSLLIVTPIEGLCNCSMICVLL